jgi:hypothetical protein
VEEIHVRASVDTTFTALLEQLGPLNETPERPMPMRLEAWPGGRWYRDLGDGNGHFWGHIQAIKRPTLLEISGCIASMATIVAGTVSTGGLAALAVKIFRAKQTVQKPFATPKSKENL